MIAILPIFDAYVPMYPISIRRPPRLDIASGNVDRTIMDATVNVPRDQMPVQSDTTASLIVSPEIDKNEMIFPFT